MSTGRSAQAPAEPRLERLLVRIVPGLPEGWQGAAAEDVARLEALAGRPLPACYRWFLERMGASLGPMTYPSIDFSARTLLSVYADGRMAHDPRFLLIGYEHDELSPLHYFYDLDTPMRGDARVVRMLTPRDETHEQFETLREMLAWGELWAQRVSPATQQCKGTLRAQGADVPARLGPVLAGLGFDAPIETGACCGLYEREDATLLCTGVPGEVSAAHGFSLGGRDAGSLSQVLAAIAGDAALQLDIASWQPGLPGRS